MKLYYSPGACSLAPHIVAREAGVPVDLVKVDLLKHRLEDGSDYRKVNPRGYVPLLELEDGERFTEASTLVQILAELGRNTDLLPPDVDTFHSGRLAGNGATYTSFREVVGSGAV